MRLINDFTLMRVEQKDALGMYRINEYQTDVRIGTKLDFETFAREGYSLNSLVYACLSKTAGAAANISYNHVDADKNMVDNSPIQEILDNPNPYQTQTQMLQTIILHRKIAGISYWEVERTKAGKPKYLWPLRPDYVEKKLNADGIEYYLFGAKGSKNKKKIEEKNVIEFKAISPTDPLFSGQSALEPIAGIIDVDQAITSFLSLFFQRGANPTGYLKVNKKIQSEDEADSIIAKFMRRIGGSKKWDKPIILDEDADYKTIGSRLNELESDKLDSRNEARICMALDVPPIMVGAKVGLDRSTYSNYKEARASWWEDTLIPMFDGIGDDLNRVLLRLFGVQGTIKLDTSRVVALKEDRTSSWERAEKAYMSGLITKNQALQEMGLPTVGGGDVYYEPPQTLAIKSQQIETKAKPDEDEFSEQMDRYFNGLLKRVEENAN